MKSQGLYIRYRFGNESGKHGPIDRALVSKMIEGLMAHPACKDSMTLVVEIQTSKFVESPEDHAQAEHDAIVKRKLQESEDAGRNAREGEDWHSYVERTIRDEVWPNEAYAMNTADFLFGPSPEGRRFKEDSMAQTYMASQATRATWDRLTPDEKRQLCRHMEDNWQDTRFWIGEHRFTD